MHTPQSFYDISKSYEENYERGPVLLNALTPPNIPDTITAHFLGFPLTIPFGIPAGPLLNSSYIKKAFDFGFAAATYKTVRANVFSSHPFPNVVLVDAPKDLHPDQTPRLVITNEEKPIEEVSITNSFGVPSKEPHVWQDDVKKALSYEKPGSLLILSFMGTVKEGQTKDELIEDHVKAAKLAKETGVKVLEVNLSCPNIGNEGLICYDLMMTRDITKAIRRVLGSTPLILKVGYYKDDKQLETLAEITQESANAIATINTLQTEIVDENGNQALPGKMRLRSGVCGASIKWAGIEMIKKLKKIKEQKGYTYELVGIGGVMTPQDYQEYSNAGADLVQSATGAMWDPYLAKKISKGH